MRHLKRVVYAASFFLIFAFVSNVWSLDPGLESAYREGRILLREGKAEQAMSVFKDLAEKAPTDLSVQLGIIDAKTEQARQQKEDNNPEWEHLVSEAFGDLKRIFPENQSSPGIYLSFAKTYWVNNRPGSAVKYLKKAFYYDRNYTEAFIFQGNMHLDKGEQAKDSPLRKVKKDLKRHRLVAMKSYKVALANGGLDEDLKGMIYYKMGEVYEKLSSNKRSAKKMWGKAISTAPESFWGKQAEEKLNAMR